MKTFYITTPIFYPNASLHMGHAYTVTLCDILYRAHKMQGDTSYFLTGSDENTAKILKSIEERGETLEQYLTYVTGNFKKLFQSLDISYDQFIQTSDKEKHWPGAVELWKKLVEAGDIYKSTYKGLYCVGCEAFYTEKDLTNGLCPLHLTPPQVIEEENYFFRLSKYTQRIADDIRSDRLHIVPSSRKNEILALLDRGLEDISFSRPKATVPHAIPVPGDDSQVIYVWCDALVNYISALGYGRDDELFKKFWPASVHVIGKDILRFHAAIWPAMLMSAGLPLPKALLVHGFITSGGHKMSKSLGNVINPQGLIDEYGHEAVRYYFAREISPFEDGDITQEKFKESYNAHLANGIGNLVSRIMKMAETHLDHPVNVSYDVSPQYIEYMNSFDVHKASDVVWSEIRSLDQYIQDNQPFKVIKTDRVSGIEMITELVTRLSRIAYMLEPILPQTASRIHTCIIENKVPGTPLFARKD